MANSVAVTIAQLLSVVETIDDASLGSNNGVTHSVYQKAQTVLNSASTPGVSQVVSTLVTLTGGAKTLDLESLSSLNEGVKNMTGLTLVALYMKASDDNANPISIEPGATNGYDLFGSDFKVSLDAGDSVLLYSEDNNDAVAGTDKDIDFAGVDTQSAELTMVFSD